MYFVPTHRALFDNGRRLLILKTTLDFNSHPYCKKVDYHRTKAKTD